MDQSITETLSISNIANRLRVSENTFFRIFKNATSISPAKFFRILRLANGHWSLLNTSLSISTIAHLYRFSDSSHFTRTYTEFYNVTPTAMRSYKGDIKKHIENNHTLNNLEKQILTDRIFVFT